MLTYGAYGGRFVPETLIPALDELELAWNEAKDDPAFARGIFDLPALPIDEALVAGVTGTP